MSSRCDGTVRFVIPRDQESRIRFAPIQSEAGMPYLEHFGLSKEEAMNSLIFVEHGVMYRKSAAALSIASYLTFPYYLISYVGALVPQVVGDTCYDFVARHRYQWFGKSETCIFPSKSVKSRYLPGATKILWTAEELPAHHSSKQKES